MTPRSARLTLAAIVGVFAATSINALFLQDGVRTQHRVRDVSTTSVIVSPPQDTRAEETGSGSTGGNALPPAATKPANSTARLNAAVARELSRKGYPVQQRDPAQQIDPAIVVYEFDAGLALTGLASDALLKRLIFDLNPAPRGSLADRAEQDSQLVLSIQKILLELGFFSGALSGRMDSWTAKAISAFERHRGVQVTGRLTEATLTALIVYSGHPIDRTVVQAGP